METLGVISPMEEPTPWCAGMVVVPKKSGDVRICVDFRPLNANVLREVHPLPKMDETLACLAGATIFSKLDANCRFWQIPLSEESHSLTTFITPFGRYAFNKLPFGICSAPEHFQRRMNQILSGHEGTLCHIDDVLIFGKTQQEHDARLCSALVQIQSAGLTLNAEKCEFSKSEIMFLGHVINKDGISPDPDKTNAVLAMPEPNTPTELRRFVGMVNQLGKFSSKISELSQPLHKLLGNKQSWFWGPAQDDAFRTVKAELAKPTTLALYDQNAPTKIAADASAYGLEAVILQKHEDNWKPIAYASKSMTETERRYSQIEKEALALVWACEKFSDYVLGKKIQLETDHKPHLDCLPPRILRFRLRLMQFNYSISHVPGKELYTADALSRAPITSFSTIKEVDDHQTELFINAIDSSLPASADSLQEYQAAQQADNSLIFVKEDGQSISASYQEILAIRGTCPQLSGMHQGYAGSETAPNFHPPSRTSMGEACFRSLRDKWQHISARRGLLFTVHGSTDAFNNNVSCSYSSVEGHICTSRHPGNID